MNIPSALKWSISIVKRAGSVKISSSIPQTQFTRMPKQTFLNIYCDTSSLFSNANKPTSQQEATAVLRLLQYHHQGKIRLSRSNVALRELERTGDPIQKNALLRDFLDLAPIANDEKVLGFDTLHTDPCGGHITNPLVSDVQDEYLVRRLEELGLPKQDAQHLAQAISNGVDVFLTRDDEHFLSKRRILGTQFRIKIRLPSETLAELALRLG